jgi:metallo-beta-lactamase family protein
MKLSFVGAAQEVTGSCYLVETDDLRFLVDCGMHQGGREAQMRNREPWPVDPRTLDFVLVTHAHIDHSGLLPRLCAHGFKGPIYATRATADLLTVMLLDSAFIQENDWARNQRRKGRGRRPPRADAELLYTVAQAQDCLTQVQGVDYDAELQPHDTVRCRFRDAGHILGSAIVELWVTEDGRTRKIVFSGDLGQPDRPIVRDPTLIDQADVLLVESTYGNRLHRPLADTVDELCAVVNETLQRRQGNVIVPAFALGRTQELLVLLAQLRHEGRLPPMQVFVDSPMADKVTGVTARHWAELDPQGQSMWGRGQALPDGLQIRFTQSVEESMALNRIKAGAIVISASGMCDAGRIRHHLRHNLDRPECAIVIVGFQAAGTLGRRLVDGERRVRLLGEDHRVRASIHTIGGLSAHADRDALLGWLRGFKSPPGQTYVVHGEAETALGFADTVAKELGWRVRAPAAGEVVEI